MESSICIDAIINVTIIVVTMSKYIATVIKTGNSYALRVPKNYVDDAHLELGQKTVIELPIPKLEQDRSRIQDIVAQLQAISAYADVLDASTWQREVRQDRQLPGRV
jgi:antitoxin component of MazEF toxin-antitoxin module